MSRLKIFHRMRKDKKQVVGEEIDDEQIKLFLEVEPPRNDTPAALHKLIKAYRGLRSHDFERFLTFFVQAGFDLRAKNARGEDFLALIQDQRKAGPYIAAVHQLLGP